MEKNATSSSAKIYVGLDIGTTKIATIVGYVGADKKIEILGIGKCESTGVEHGIIQNVFKTNECIKNSIALAESRSGEKISVVCAGVAGQHIKSTEYQHAFKRPNGKGTVISQEEIDSFVERLWHILLQPEEQIIDVIPQRYEVDGHVTFEPVGEQGENVKGLFQVVTGRENDIRNIINCINNAHVKVSDIILEPLASGTACLTDEEQRQGVILIDIGGGTTDISVYYQGSPVFTEVIPFGGNSITNDISNICRISMELAEKVKIEHGTCIEEHSKANNVCVLPTNYGNGKQEISEPYLAKIINARVKDIVKKVQNVIERCPYKDHLNAGIVLTGGGASMRHIQELFSYELGLPVRIGIPGNGFGRNIPAELKQPMYSTALGLLKYAVINNPPQEDENEYHTTQPVPTEPAEEHKSKEKKTVKRQSPVGNNLGSKLKTAWDKLLDNLVQATE